MALRIPQNQIIESKYTSGKEYMFDSTYKEYIGYYYELNGKLFAGKEFEVNAPELIRINSSGVNNLLTNPFTYIYGIISNIALNQNIKIPSLPFSPTDEDFGNGFIIRYFSKKINVTPIFIKEISKETFDQIQSDPLYQTLEVKYNFNITDKELDELDKKMPGLKAYLDDYALPTSSDETNPFIS